MKRIALPRPRLDVRDLQIVLALASAGSTVKAAASLHLTQSAVSRGLLVVERKVGRPLFERTARGLTPTSTGQKLLSGATSVLEQLADLESQVRAPGKEPAQIKLVCECYTAYRWLPSALTTLRHRLPDVELQLAVDHTHAPVDGLVSGDVDIALLTTAPVRGKVHDRALFSDEIVFVVASSHPLAARASITAADLREHPLITGNAPPGETRWFTSTVFGRKMPADVRFLRFPLTEAIIDAARAGMGIAILSEWIAAPYLSGGGIVIKRLASGPLQRPWRIAFRKECDGIAADLAAALAECAPRIEAPQRPALRIAR
jgi:LysR family transcriptional regulator for metE and metH